MAKLRKKIKILGYQYKIIPSPDIQASAQIYSLKQIIKLGPDQCEEQQISAIFHEIIEALNYHMELKLEHAAIMGLESGLYQVLKDAGINLRNLLYER